jgi:hypothetical protein
MVRAGKKGRKGDFAGDFFAVDFVWRAFVRGYELSVATYQSIGYQESEFGHRAFFLVFEGLQPILGYIKVSDTKLLDAIKPQQIRFFREIKV